jgi:NADH-quinone oxidoreductase subunit F
MRVRPAPENLHGFLPFDMKTQMPSREHWLIPESPHETYASYLADLRSSAVEIARKRSPDEVLEAIQRSGLRGRGGAGFPTGLKWRSVKEHRCATRYVVCNAAEGEPGTFKDRYLLRRNPYAVIEGLLVAAHVVHAKECFVALKRSFAREVAIVRHAVDEMKEAGALGGLSVRIVEGPEEYLYGEEKALLEVVEGNEPLPRAAHQPPYEIGLFATPTSPNPAIVNNTETFAHVSTIVRSGAESFRKLGTHDTSGTLLVTLCGSIARPGVFEVEAGTPLSHILLEMGGGPRPGRRFKALLSGVSSPVILPERFDTPADFGSLALIHSGLGSAGFVVVDDSESIPSVCRAVARFLYVESCNQCSACKVGLRTASRVIDAIFGPLPSRSDTLERAIAGASSAPQANRCFLPVEGSLLIPSLINAFRREFDAQLGHPASTGSEWPLPKIVDFDEVKRSFRYDERQALKQPDWTYREPPPHQEILEEHLLHLEKCLLDPRLRSSGETPEQLLAEDFVEFGSSGRQYHKQQALAAMQIPRNSGVAIHDFQIRELGHERALVTYRASDGEAESLRSSIWVHQASEWRVIFHQGTPVMHTASAAKPTTE